MRIVAGEYRGRRVAAPPGTDTRPTTDRVREAVFSAVASIAGTDLGGGAVLDAFAGSGALGLEALSRGCSSATFVERDKRALATVRANVDVLGAGRRARVIAGDACSLAGRGGLVGGPFALLLLDPPYRLALSEVGAFTSALAENGQLEPGAVVVWEHAAGNEPAWDVRFSLATRKRYGTTEVDIAVYGGESESS